MNITLNDLLVLSSEGVYKLRIAALQLPYPKTKTHQSAKAYQNEILYRLKTIAPEATELLVLPAYINAAGLLEPDLLFDLVKTHGENFYPK